MLPVSLSSRAQETSPSQQWYVFISLLRPDEGVERVLRSVAVLWPVPAGVLGPLCALQSDGQFVDWDWRLQPVQADWLDTTTSLHPAPQLQGEVGRVYRPATRDSNITKSSVRPRHSVLRTCSFTTTDILFSGVKVFLNQPQTGDL